MFDSLYPRLFIILLKAYNRKVFKIFEGVGNGKAKSKRRVRQDYIESFLWIQEILAST